MSERGRGQSHGPSRRTCCLPGRRPASHSWRHCPDGVVHIERYTLGQRVR